MFLSLIRVFAVLVSLFVNFASVALPREPDACKVLSIVKSPETGIKIRSPDGRKYLANKKDKNEDYQIYVGRRSDAEPVCLSHKNMPGAPPADRNKMQVNWHPSGKWIIYAGEKESYNERWLPKRLRQGFLECGCWMDIYAMSPDGRRGFNLYKTKSGFTGVAFTPDGRHGVWAEAVSGLTSKAAFGKWTLRLADFVEKRGVPALVNVKDITPAVPCPTAPWSCGTTPPGLRRPENPGIRGSRPAPAVVHHSATACRDCLQEFSVSSVSAFDLAWIIFTHLC
jgi:hypothetical protein